VTIRSARAADVPMLGRLGAMLVQSHHELDRTRFIPATPRTAEGYASFLGSQLGRHETVLLVADREGVVVGYAWGALEGTDYMALRGPAGVLHDLVVDPADRHQGLGRMLLEAAVEALRALGAPRVVLSTAARNDPAQRLFTAAGFRPTTIELTRDLNDQ
jgi:ribosomal protein S18 acetylase RimI-like enzyme